MKGYLLFLLLTWCHSIQGGQLLHSVTGEVSRGEFTYYILMFDGPITLNLYSRTGDADLYISQYVSKPSYELDSHCLQSVTCGVDTVHIPISFKRPIGIGIYGHPSHEQSTYLLEASYSDEENIEIEFSSRDNSSFEDIEQDIQADLSAQKGNGNDQSGPNSDSKARKGPDVRDSEAQEGELSSFWSLIWPFIEILLDVLIL